MCVLQYMRTVVQEGGIGRHGRAAKQVHANRCSCNSIHLKTIDLNAGSRPHPTRGMHIGQSLPPPTTSHTPPRIPWLYPNCCCCCSLLLHTSAIISSSRRGLLTAVSACITARYLGRRCVNQWCRRTSGIVMRLSGSTSSMRGMRSRAPGWQGEEGRVDVLQACLNKCYDSSIIFWGFFRCLCV